MSEYIEREFALNVLCRENCGHDYEANKCNNCYTSNFINYLPTADVAEVKHGKWMPVESHFCFLPRLNTSTMSHTNTIKVNPIANQVSQLNPCWTA